MRIHRARLALCAAAVLAVLVVPIAAASGSGGSEATASASVKKQLRKLKKQVRKLRRQVDEVEKQSGPAGDQGPPGPPGPAAGPAGGDLAGNYPNPSIAGGAVTSPKLGADAVNSVKVDDDSLDATDIADTSSLGSLEVDERSLREVGGYLPSHISDLGGDGTTRFGSLSGVSTASANADDVAAATGDSLRIGRLQVFLTEELGSGESRTFTLMAGSFPTSITCTVTPGPGIDSCSDSEVTSLGSAFFTSIRVESSGGGISPTADARIALSTWIDSSQE